MAASVVINVPTPSSPEAGFTPSSGQNSPESAASPTSQSSTEKVTKRKKKPYKELTLEEKVCLIKLAEENNCMSQASIAERYSIAKSNVCRILQRKQEYLLAFESAGFAGTRKRKLRKDLTISKSKKNEKKFSISESNPDPIPKPIPIKPEVGMNIKENLVCKQEETISENPATSNLLHINAEGHKSAFHHLELPILCNPQLLVPHFVTAQYGYQPFDLPCNLLPFPSNLLADETLSRKPLQSNDTTMNLILNQALLKQVELLNKKLEEYEGQLEKVRLLIKNAENTKTAPSSDAQILLNSLINLL